MRRALKKFPNIADPGADRILLFGGMSPVAAVPSNNPHVLVRIQSGPEGKNYGETYRKAQQMIAEGVPATFDVRMRAYLLLKQHRSRFASAPSRSATPARWRGTVSRRRW
jgi:endonuclease-3